MARQKQKDDEGNDFGTILVSTLLGIAIGAPSQVTKQKLKYFDDNKAEFRFFQQNRLVFHEFLNQKQDFENFKKEQAIKHHRIISLGTTRIDSNIQSYPNANELFGEIVHMYASGFFRATCVFAAALIERILKEEFGDKKFVDLINEANSKNLISNNDKNYLHGLRLDRNDYVHSTSQQMTEEDAKFVILLTIRLLNNFFQNKKTP